jgi:cytochrome c556
MPRGAVTVALIAWTLANAGIGVTLYRIGGRPPAAPDARTAVVLPTEARAAVLAEMRTMLGSLNGILVAAGRGDSAAMSTAARRSGLAAAADPALEKLLPEAWLQEMALATHLSFDSVAAAAGADVAGVVNRLSSLTGNCVACHATYRLETGSPGRPAR